MTLKKRRILIADGHASDARLAALSLRSALSDVEVKEVGDPVALGREIAAGHWDLVIASHMPPWGDAHSVIRAVREALPRTPVVLLADEPDTAAALRAGFSDFVPKTSEGFLHLPTAVQEIFEKAEESRRQTRLETRLQGLLDEAGVGFFRATLGGRLLEVNPYFLSVLGVETLTAARDLELPSPYFRRQSRDELLRHLDEKGALYASELELPGDGGPRWISLTERLCLDLDGELVVDGLLVDLTERKEAERSLEERASELDRSNQDLQRFAYVASHELQAPLRLVEKYSEMLAEDSAKLLDADGAESLSFIREGVERMQRLIDDLLAFSRVESRVGASKLLSLEDSLRDSLADLATEIDESQAKIEIADLPRVVADPAQIGVLFHNLIANAIKFRGEQALRIQIRSQQVEDGWEISVEDNGIGIEAGHRESIFEVFRRLHAEFPGSGLGLTICRKIVERHGGRIWVRAAEGGGSVFCFLLPGSPSAGPHEGQEKTPHEKTRGRSNQTETTTEKNEEKAR